MKENWILLFCILPSMYCILTENVESLGCWKESKKSSFVSFENKHHFLTGPYNKRKNAVEKCARVAIDHGFTVFALQNGGKCLSGANGIKRFNFYGPSNLCKDGKGGPWSNNVYSTKTFHTRSFSSLRDETPWDAYCTRPLDIVVLMDGSGNINDLTKKRWVLIKNFVKKFIRGFDDHTRIGIIQYGDDPEIIQDIRKLKSKESLDSALEKAELPGGERTLNDALKRAWREQLKETNRTNADKIILATTTGDIPYGLYGSSQFLSDHNVRIVVVGIDKFVHYEFLQSVASYHDVGNIFSVNSGQLDDVAPYIYRDICNNMPEYVLATTPTPSKERPIDLLKQKNKEDSKSKTKENQNNNFSDVKSSKSSRTAPAKSRGEIPPFARENYDDFDESSANKIVGTSKTLNDVTSKKHLITAVRNDTSKEKVATMVLINPSPDVFLGLTPNEVTAIENRHNPSNEEMKKPNTFLPKVSLKNQDSAVVEVSEAKNISKITESLDHSKITESLDHSKMFSLDSLHDKGSSEPDDQWEELAPIVINEETNSFKKLDNLNENGSLSEISGLNGKSGKSLENPKPHSMLKMKNKQVANPLQVKKPSKFTSKVNETKSMKTADKAESKKDPHVELAHPMKEPEHPVKGTKSQYFPIKLFSSQGHEPPDGLKNTNGNQNVGSNPGNEAKVSDLNIHGLGALSQTLELHAGNGKEHVSYHPSYRKAHQSLFTDKLKDRMKEPHSMFAGRDEVMTTQERKNNKQLLKASKRLDDFTDAPSLLNSAGKNLAEIYLQIHKAERTNLEMPNTVEGFLGKKGNVYTNTRVRSGFTTHAGVAGKTITYKNAYKSEGENHSSKFLKDKVTNDQSIKESFHRSQLTQGSFSFNKSVSPADGVVNLIKSTIMARKKFYIDQGNSFEPFLIGADYNEGLGFDSQSDELFLSEKGMLDNSHRSLKKIKNNTNTSHSTNNLIKNKQKFALTKKEPFFTNVNQRNKNKKPLIPSKRFLPTSPLKNDASSAMSNTHKKTLHTLSIDNLKLLDNDAVVHGNIRIDGSKVNFITEEINRTKTDILNSTLGNHFSDINLSENVKTENISDGASDVDSGQSMNTTSSGKTANSSEVHHNGTENQRNKFSSKSKYQFRDGMGGRDNSYRNNTTQFHKVSYKLESNNSSHVLPTNITKKEKNIARLNELLNTFEKHFKDVAKNNNISLYNVTADGYLKKDGGGHFVFPKDFYNAHIKNPQINNPKNVKPVSNSSRSVNVKPTKVKPTNEKSANVKLSNVKPTNLKPSVQIESYKGKTSKKFINHSKGKKSFEGKGNEIMLMKNFDANIQKYNHNILDKISLLVNAMKPVMNAHIDFKSQGEDKLGVNKDFTFKIGDPSATSTPYKPTSSPKPKTTSRPTTTQATTTISTTTSTTVFAVQFGYQYNPASGTGFILPNTIPNPSANNASVFENPQNIPGFVINNVSGDLTQINNNNNFGNLTNPNIAIPSSDGKVYLPGNYEMSAKKERTAPLVVPSYTTSLSSKRNDQAVKGPSIGFQSNIRTLTQDTFQPLNQMIKKFYKSGDIHQVIDVREPNLDDAVDELKRVMDDRIMDNLNHKGTNTVLTVVHPLLNNNHVAVLKPSDQHVVNSTIDSEFDSSPVISQQRISYRPLANVHNNKLVLFKNVPYLENTAKIHETPASVNNQIYDTLEPGVHNNSIEEESFSQDQEEILPQSQYQNHEELNSPELLYSVEPDADMQGENRPVITVNENHGVFHNTSYGIQTEDLLSTQPGGGGVHETVSNDNETPKLISSQQLQHEIVSANSKAGSFSGPDEWYHIRVSQNGYHRKHPQVITYKQEPHLHSINHPISIQKQSSHYVASNPLINQVPINVNEGENIVHEHEHAADGLNMHYKHHKGLHHLQALAHTLHQPQELKKAHMDLVKQEHTKLKYSYLGMNTLERKHRLKAEELNRPSLFGDLPRVTSKHFKHNGFPMFNSSFKNSKRSRNFKANTKFKRMRQPTLPHPPEINALPSMPNFITNHLSYKPRLNRPIYPIMTPHAAPDSHSIFRHEKKGSISASRLRKRILDEKKRAAMQLLNQNINGKFLHGREHVAENLDQTKEIEYTKLPLSNAWTETDFLPKKGPPLFRTNKTLFVYQSPKERETIAKTLQKILWINALVGRKGDEEAKLHHDKHASFKAYLLHELENYEKNAENQSASRAVDRSASPKNIITHNLNSPYDLSYQNLKKSFWVSKTAGPFEEHNVYHIAARDKLNKQEAVNHLSAKDQNSFSNTTGSLKDYDIMYLENTDSIPKNIIDETSSDSDLMTFSSQERIMKNAEKRTNQRKGEMSAKEESSLMKQKSVKQLNFDDFPRSFLIKDFNLGDMPSLPVGKSYVLSTPSIGTVTVRIKNDLSDESQESNSNHKKNHYFTKAHRKKFSHTNKYDFVKQTEKNKDKNEGQSALTKKEKSEDRNDEQAGENEDKTKLSSTKPKVFLNERNRLVAVPENVLYGRKYNDDDEEDSKENNENELKAEPTNSLMESGENIPEENKDNREILGNSEGKNQNKNNVNEAELTDMVHAVLKNIVNESKVYMMNLIKSDKADYLKDFLDRNHESKNLTGVVIQNTTVASILQGRKRNNTTLNAVNKNMTDFVITANTTLVNNSLRVDQRNKSIAFDFRVSENSPHKNASLDNITRGEIDKTDSGIRDDIYVTTKMSNAFNLTIDKIPEEKLKKTFSNNTFMRMTALEYMLGCAKPLRILYAIDVSDGLGDGFMRKKKWNRLKDFISDINSGLFKDVRTNYMVYNIEPRFMESLDGCDRNTEYFLTADDCLCGTNPLTRSAKAGCSVNGPTQQESVEDWGAHGPRTGRALDIARAVYFKENLNLFKNVIFLISHKKSTDNLKMAEMNLKKDGISLVDIELGDRHDLRKKHYIPVQRNYRRSNIEENVLDEHKVKVSLKKLQQTLRSIVGRVCKSQTDEGI